MFTFFPTMRRHRFLLGAALSIVVSMAVPAWAQSDTAQPELKSAKIEFIPGEKTVFYDDFTDMAKDEPPPHWKVREGKVELKVGGDLRELYNEGGVNLTSPQIAVPRNFTFELQWTGGGETTWSFRDKDDGEAIHVVVRGEEDGMTASVSIDAKDHLGEGTIQTDTSKPVTFALWGQQGRVRAYLNGERLVDSNQVEFNPITRLEATIGCYRPNGIRCLRIAESSPDFRLLSMPPASTSLKESVSIRIAIA
jgi:hypothetical protein